MFGLTESWPAHVVVHPALNQIGGDLLAALLMQLHAEFSRSPAHRLGQDPAQRNRQPLGAELAEREAVAHPQLAQAPAPESLVGEDIEHQRGQAGSKGRCGRPSAAMVNRRAAARQRGSAASWSKWLARQSWSEGSWR